MVGSVPILDWTAIRNAVAAGTAVVLPSSLIASSVFADPPRWLIWSFAVVTVVGLGLAGAWAGWHRGDTPILHGGTAAVATYAVVLVVGAARRALASDDVALTPIVVTAVVALCVGVAGGLLGDRLQRGRRYRRTMASDTIRAGESAG